MICKCAYFNYVNGKLVCSVCGKPAAPRSVIEDKIDKTAEVKTPQPVNKNATRRR